MLQHATFNPTPDLADAAIARLCDPALSFNDVARSLACSPEALSLWVARSAIAERLTGFDAALIARTRLIAQESLPKSIRILSAVLDCAAAELDQDARTLRAPAPNPASSQPPAPPASPAPRSPELRQRTLETARRAATRIIQLASFNPPPLFHTRTAAAITSPRIGLPHPTPTPASQPAPRPRVEPAPQPPAPPVPTSPAPATSAPRAPRTPNLSTLAAAASLASPVGLAAPALPFSRSRPSAARSPASLLSTAGARSSSLLDLPILSSPHTHWP